MKEIRTVQYLRAIAAISVVIYHGHLQLERLGYTGWWPDFLKSGVDVFFVISGFIMWITTCRRTITPMQFIEQRIIRIAPLYWVFTSFVLAVMLLSPSAMQSSVFDIDNVIKSFLFIPAMNGGAGDMVPIIAPGWTLNYEMFFYCLFALCLLLPVRGRAAALLAMLASLTLLRPLFPQAGTVGHFYTSTIILEFGLGALIGMCFMSDRAGRLFSPTLSAGLVIAGGALTVLHPVAGLVGWGGPAALIVLGCVMLERRIRIPRFGVACALGDCSYSLYLSHGMVLSALGQAWRAAGLAAIPGSTPLFTVTAVTVTCGVAMVAFRLLECPMTNGLRATWKRRPSLAAPAMSHPTPA